MEKALPAIPAKRYFTIGEVSDLCGVKPYVLRYWEQEFTQLKPMKRRGNRRYNQHHEVLLIRRIRDLLYDQGFTISGARNRLADAAAAARAPARAFTAVAAEMPRRRVGDLDARDTDEVPEVEVLEVEVVAADTAPTQQAPVPASVVSSPRSLRAELQSIRRLLEV